MRPEELKEGKLGMKTPSPWRRALVGTAIVGLLLGAGQAAFAQRGNMIPAQDVGNGYISAKVGALTIEDDDDLGTHSLMRGKIYLQNTGGEPLSATDGARAVSSDAYTPDNYYDSDTYARYIDQYLSIAVSTGEDAILGPDDPGIEQTGDPTGWDYYVFGGDATNLMDRTGLVDGVESAIQAQSFDDAGLIVTQVVTPYRDKVRIQWYVDNNGDVAQLVKLRFRHRPAPLGVGDLFGRAQSKVYIDGFGWTDEAQTFWKSTGGAALPKRWVSYAPGGEMAVGWTAVTEKRLAGLLSPYRRPVMDAPPAMVGMQFLPVWLYTPHPVWWEYQPPGSLFTEGVGLAVHYFWKSQSIEPGESQMWELWLGDEWSVSNVGDPLHATSSARSAVGLAEDPDTGEWIWDLGSTGELKIGGGITNRWDSAMRSGTMTVTLPEGLTLAPGESAAKTVPTLDPGETGEVSWSVIPDPNASLAGELSWTTTASASAKGGVYSSSLTNSISFPALNRLRTAVPVLPPDPDDRAGYQYLMMSVPFDLDDPDPVSGLRYTDTSGGAVTPRVWRFNPVLNAWDEYPQGTADRIRPGYGYFVRVPVQSDITVPTDGSAHYLNSAPEIVVPLEGRTSGGTYAGFNQIGNPFTYSLPLGDVSFISRGVTYTYDQSWSAGWIPGVVWEWDPGANSGRGGYILQHGRTFVLDPWKAYWILAYTDLDMVMTPPEVRGATPPTGDLVVTPPAPESEGGVSSASCTAKATGANSSGDWLLQLEAECSEAADTQNWIGASPAVAQAGNRRCVLDPPPVGRYVQVAFPHSDWGGANGLYALDLRPASGDLRFDMKVATNVPNAEVRVSWPSIAHLPRDLSLVLTDLETGEKTFMRTSADVSFVAGPEGGTRSYRIDVSRTARGLQISELSADSTSRGASIAFTLSESAQVDVAIVNSAGRVVRTLASATETAAGRSVFTWDGRSDRGASAAGGEYRVRIEAYSQGGGHVVRTAPVSLR